MPCLKTKEFWAPIATIKERPRKKPVKKAGNILNTFKLFILKDFLGYSHSIVALSTILAVIDL